MSALEVNSIPESELAPFVIPIPRTCAVAEVWSEFATAIGVPQDTADHVIKPGLANFLIDTLKVYFLKHDLVVAEFRLTMDWKRHELLIENCSDIPLSPRQPFVLQLHDGLAEALKFIHAIKAREKVERVEYGVCFRPEVEADAKLRARALAFLGVKYVPAPTYAPGKIQPDLTFRLGVLTETTFSIRENWT